MQAYPHIWLLALLPAVVLGPPAPAEELLLSSFEDATELARWQVAGDGRLTPDHATAGAQALEVSWPQGRGLISGGLPGDWSAWDVLKLDCYNPGPPFTVTLRVDDNTGTSASSWYHYLRTGATTLEVPVRALSEGVDITHIRSAHLRVDPALQRPITLYVDNVRFSRGEPGEVYQPPALPPAADATADGNLLANGDFEHGLLSWDPVEAPREGTYDLGTGSGNDAHSGNVSAAVTCTRVGRGGIASRAVRGEEAGQYGLSFWAKGSLGGKVQFGLVTARGEALREAQVGQEWQELRATAALEAGDKVAVWLLSCAPGTVWLDGVRLVRELAPGETPKPVFRPAPENPNNRIRNPNFELGLHNWGSWGEWEGGLYEFGTGARTEAYSGEHSAAVICSRRGRGGIMTQPIELEPDTYTLRFMAKASAGSSIRYGAIYPGGQAFMDGAADGEWKEVTLSLTSTKEGEWRVYLMSTGEGTVYFDEASLVGTRPVQVAAEAKDPDEQAAVVELRDGHTFVNGKPFFALGMYRATPEDLKGTAFNCIPGWDAPDAAGLDACAEAGIYGLPDLSGVMRGHLPQRVSAVAKPLMNHPAVLAWYVCDEPDHQRWNVPPDEMRLASRVLRELDPRHPTCAVVMPWAASNLYRYADSVDILMTDIYPIGGQRPADLASIWRSTATMRRAVGDRRPIWAVLQATAQGTPQEHVAATYLAVVEGSDGIFYWELQDAKQKPEVWQQVVALAGELNSLRDALTSADAREQASASSRQVRSLRKNAPEGDVLIAVNGSADTQAQCELKVPGGGSGQAVVMFEGREVAVRNGALVDGFEPFARHVYRLP